MGGEFKGRIRGDIYINREVDFYQVWWSSYKEKRNWYYYCFSDNWIGE